MLKPCAPAAIALPAPASVPGQHPCELVSGMNVSMFCSLNTSADNQTFERLSSCRGAVQAVYGDLRSWKKQLHAEAESASQPSSSRIAVSSHSGAMFFRSAPVPDNHDSRRPMGSSAGAPDDHRADGVGRDVGHSSAAGAGDDGGSDVASRAEPCDDWEGASTGGAGGESRGTAESSSGLGGVGPPGGGGGG
jgi:hypothetical protein